MGIFHDSDILRNGLPILVKGPYRKMNIEHFKLITQVVYPIPYRVTQEYMTQQKIDLVINYQLLEALPFYYDIFGEIVDTQLFE